MNNVALVVKALSIQNQFFFYNIKTSASFILMPNKDCLSTNERSAYPLVPHPHKVLNNPRLGIQYIYIYIHYIYV